MSQRPDWKSLQNESDIRGVALDGTEEEPVNLTPERVHAIGAAFVYWIREKPHSDRGPRISVGMDSRVSGPILKTALIEGLLSAEGSVGDAHLASTPAMFMSTVFSGYEYDGAIMLTASHLPPNRNGMKFFTKEGGLEKRDITDLLERAEQGGFATTGVKGEKRRIHLMNDYAEFLVNRVREDANYQEDDLHPLTGFKIIVDAGNGAGGFFADKVLEPLGADTTGSLFLEPDGTFPNHDPNPEDTEAMNSICQSLLEQQADLGIIFDPDVDRAAIVAATGEVINRNKLIALISAIILEEHPGSTIVTDSVTSDGLHQFIEQNLGGRHHRFKRGYKNVINEAIQLNCEDQETHLAIETSGHAALKENYFLDDGAFLITKLLTKMSQMRKSGQGSLINLIEDLREPAESSEFRLKIYRDDYKEYGNSIIQSVSESVVILDGWEIVVPNYEGVRVSCDQAHGDGWFLLRVSLHGPEIVLNVESEQQSGIWRIVEKLIKIFDQCKYKHLDLSALKQYVKRNPPTLGEPIA